MISPQQITSYILTILTLIEMKTVGLKVEPSRILNTGVKQQPVLLATKAMCNHINSAVFPLVQLPGVCIMSDMGLRQVPSNIPINVTVLDLGNNCISEISNASFPHSLKFLRELNLKHNVITSLDVGSFRNLANLQVLDLSYNGLISAKYFPDYVFTPIAGSLRTLYLQGNIPVESSTENYMLFPEKALSMLTQLTNLVLDGTGNIYLGPGFTKMVSLRNLSFGFEVKSCITHTLFNDTFRYVTKELTFLNMSHCNLRHISNISLVGFNKLTYLDLSHNYNLNLSIALQALNPLYQHFQYIGFGSVNPFIQLGDPSQLGPSNTRLSDWNAKHFLRMCIVDLDLSNNSIVYINTSLMSKPMIDCLRNLNLHNNVLNGSVSTHTFLKRLSSSGSLQTIDLSFQRSSLADGYNLPQFSGYKEHRMFDRSGFIKISVPPSLVTANFSMFLTSSHEELFGKYQFLGANSLSVVDFSNNTIDCQTEVIGLEKVTSLRISNIDCSRLNISVFRAFPKLRYLWIDDTHLSDGFKTSKHQLLLEPLPCLQFVSMSNNGLASLHRRFFNKTQNITTINLSGNNLKALQIEWLDLQFIKEIDLSYNNITNFDTNITQKLEALAMNRDMKIHLKGNVLSCSCEHLEFVKWLISTNVILDDEQGYHCTLPSGSLSDTNYVRLAMDELEVKCLSPFMLVTVIGLSIPLITILLLAAVFYRYRWTLQFMWWKIKMQWGVNVTIIETSEGISNDLFVMYSHSDTEWVVQVLVDKLEKQLRFKLAFYGRDFLPGEYIRTEVVNKLCSSRCSLFVITESYLQSEYCKFETQMVAHRSLEQLNHKVFVILKDNIPVDRLPVFFQKMWARVVCLPWTEDERGQRELWRKLIKALEKNRLPVLQGESEAAEEQDNPETDLPAHGDSAAPVMDYNVLTSEAWFEDVLRHSHDSGSERERHETSMYFDDSDRKLLL